MLRKIAAAFLICFIAAITRTLPGAGKSENIIVEKKLVDKGKAVRVYRVTYKSTGLKVRGLMFENRTKKGKLPGIVFNHGGVDGIPEAFKNRCRELAAAGYHVFAPSYRGEDGSEGKVEVAAGEVDDAMNGARVLQQWPGVDAARIAMAGASHGGIITLLAAQRMDLRAAAVFYGVSNTFTWYQFLIDNGHDVTDPLSRQVYGYGPKDKPEAFRSRAPALDAARTRAPVLLVYGDSDTIVPPSQGREMAGALKKAGKTYELKIVRGAGHGFIFRNSSKSSAEDRARAAEGWNAMVAFFKKYL